MDLKIKTTELSRELAYQCYANRIDVKAYWDSHGKHIPWEGSQVIKYDRTKKLDLYRVTQLWEFECIEPQELVHLELFVDGERLTNIGDITGFTELKTKVKLDACVGAG
jgi:hypothetical protein